MPVLSMPCYIACKAHGGKNYDIVSDFLFFKCEAIFNNIRSGNLKIRTKSGGWH